MTNITKRFNIALIAGLVATSAVLSIPQALAQDRGGRGGHPPRGEQSGDRGARMFDRLDENEDGVLSLAEMTAKVEVRAEKLLAKKDSDKNGSLSLAEYSTNRRGEMQDLSDIASEIVQCVTDLKAESGNPDIVIPTADSFKSPEQRFNDLDTSANGALSLTELQVGGLAKTTERFNTMDSDGNGEVDKTEFAAANKSHRATKQAVHQCVREINDDN